MNKIAYIKRFFLLINFSLFVLFTNAQEESLTLSNALQKALENNYGIIVSKSEVEIAGINNRWANAGRYPTIAFTASSNNNKELLDDVSYNGLSGRIGLNWTLFNGFRVNITKSKLEKLEQLAVGRSGVVIENTIQDVILAYYNILLQQKRLEVLENLMKLSEDRYNYEKTKYDIGGSVTYNVLLAKNVYLEDKASYLNQEVVVRNAVRNLNFLLGEEVNQQWSFTIEFTSDTTEYKLGNLLDKMLANNQTLQNQYANLLLQQDEIKYKQGALYPRLSLSAGLENTYSWTKSSQGNNSSEGLSPYGNLTLSYDLFTAGNRKSAINIAKINQQITEIEMDEMKHSLTNQLYN